MQIAIKIDENLYTRLFDSGEDYVADMRRACVAIRKGTPLPKGHGDLIDRGELLKQTYGGDWNGIGLSEEYVYCNDIEQAPTIIEAESEAEE